MKERNGEVGRGGGGAVKASGVQTPGSLTTGHTGRMRSTSFAFRIVGHAGERREAKRQKSRTGAVRRERGECRGEEGRDGKSQQRLFPWLKFNEIQPDFSHFPQR